MAKYEFLLSIHLLAVVIWVGGAAYIQMGDLRAHRSGDARHLATVMSDAAWYGTRIFMPATLIILVTGLLLVDETGVSLSEAWVSFGFTVLILSALVGSLFFGPEAKRIGGLLQSKSLEDPELRSRSRRLFILTRIELLLLLLVVVDMAVKPGA